MRASATVLIAACVLAGLVPLLAARPVLPESISAPHWPTHWPTHFQGKPLRQLPLGEREQRFAADFPGRIGRFSDGEREIVIRWVSRETRMLHPASDCFRGLGYSIAPQPIAIDATGERWGAFTATRGKETFDVRERIYDASGAEWSDVSAWYWAAATGKSAGPWWAVTTARVRPAS